MHYHLDTSVKKINFNKLGAALKPEIFVHVIDIEQLD